MPDYEALADAAERGELKSVGPVLRGEDARKASRELLMRAAGVGSMEEVWQVVRGERQDQNGP